MDIRPGHFKSREDLLRYCRAEGLLFGCFKCAACDLEVDWYSHPDQVPSQVECPDCGFVHQTQKPEDP